MTFKLFVYGTLKKHFHNHYLLQDASYLGSGHTKDKFALYAEGIPFVIKTEPVCHVHGEVYQVDRDTLSKLDALEGHPTWYCRELTSIIIDGNEPQEVEAWLYFYPDKRGKLIKSGVYES